MLIRQYKLLIKTNVDINRRTRRLSCKQNAYKTFKNIYIANTYQMYNVEALK